MSCLSCEAQKRKIQADKLNKLYEEAKIYCKANNLKAVVILEAPNGYKYIAHQDDERRSRLKTVCIVLAD